MTILTWSDLQQHRRCGVWGTGVARIFLLEEIWASTGLVRGGLQQVHEEMHDPKALAELGSEEAAGAFGAGWVWTAAFELVKDKAAPARATSARLLADDMSDTAREVLRDALQDKSWIVRAAARGAGRVHGSRERC